MNASNCIRYVCLKIAKYRHFDNFIMFCILANTLVMAMVWFDEPDGKEFVLEILNYVFSAIFTIEAIIKLIALKKVYFNDSWNIFDFTIVVLTLVILILKFTKVPIEFGAGPTVLRALRIGRILRLIKRAK